MALIHHAKREINAKIVICGAEGVGKATLLHAIRSQLPAQNCGQMKSSSFQQDTMLFFDFSHPEGGDPRAYSLRFHVYTLTGTVLQENAWKMVLKGVDGIVFVLDSDPSRQVDNRTAFDQMQAALGANGKQVADLPAVVVCTRQELPEAVSIAQLRAGLPELNLPVYPVDSLSGGAVLYPLCELIEGILADLEKLGLALQPPVRDLCRLAPRPVMNVVTDISPEPFMPELMPAMTCTGETPSIKTPSITLDGLPEISDGGSLSVGIQVDCCGKISRATLKISLSIENQED